MLEYTPLDDSAWIRATGKPKEDFVNPKPNLINTTSFIPSNSEGLKYTPLDDLAYRRVTGKTKDEIMNPAPKAPNMGPAIASDSNPIIQYGNYNIDPNIDYMAKMNEAAAKGDYNLAAYYERMRNAKIDAGYGGQYQKTYYFNYNPKYEDKISEMRTQLENYEDFSYDPMEDEAYRNLANVYNYNAQKASKNALGLSAAANGGIASSGAATAAALAYADKMAGLEAEIPALRNAAYNAYLNDKQDVRNTMNDYMNAEALDYQRWSDNYNRRYGQESDLYARETDQARWEAEYEMQKLANNANIDAIYADIDSGKLQSELQAAALSGYVTPGLAGITGLPSGTPLQSTKEYWATLQSNLMVEKGTLPTSYLEAMGIFGIEGGNTVSRDNLNETITHNRNSEDIARAELNETSTHNRNTENISQQKIDYATNYNNANYGNTGASSSTSYTIDDAVNAYNSKNKNEYNMIVGTLSEEDRKKVKARIERVG